MVFDEKKIFLNQIMCDKNDVLRFIAKKAFAFGVVKEEKTAYEDLLSREKEMATGLQNGFAIPHCRTANVVEVSVFYIQLDNQIYWETFDKSDVKYIFCIMAPEKGSDEVHLQILSDLATKMIDETFCETLVGLSDEKQVVKYISIGGNV